jgi:hypothetical protein
MSASNLLLLAIFGGVALMLAFAGVWSVVLFSAALHADGVVTRGVVVGRRTQTVMANKPPRYIVIYAFDAVAPDGSVRKVTLAEDVYFFQYGRYTKGTPVEVKYAPQNPRLARLFGPWPVQAAGAR